MKPVLFCSILITFLSFSCKPKPLDNLKEVARQAEEHKVFRVSRERLGRETQRVSDSVLTLVLVSAQEKMRTGNTKSDEYCSLGSYEPYQKFQEKYKAYATVALTASEIKELNAEMDELRRYNNQLPEKKAGFPATFQTLTDSVLYVRQIEAGQQLCENSPTTGYWVFRFPKKKLVEIMTIKVKPKPAKGPNW